MWRAEKCCPTSSRRCKAATHAAMEPLLSPAPSSALKGR
jgi:hypothetical protein